MKTTTLETTPAQTANPEPVTYKLGDVMENGRVYWGKGKYSAIMAELHRDIGRTLSLPDDVAIKIAMDYGTDLGRLDSKVEKISIGKVAKNTGTTTLRESTKIKFVAMTPAIRIAKLVVTLDDTRVLGVESIEVKFDEKMQEWLDKLGETKEESETE